MRRPIGIELACEAVRTQIGGAIDLVLPLGRDHRHRLVHELILIGVDRHNAAVDRSETEVRFKYADSLGLFK